MPMGSYSSWGSVLECVGTTLPVLGTLHLIPSLALSQAHSSNLQELAASDVGLSSDEALNGIGCGT